MRLASRSGLIATSLAIAAITAPTAQAGLFSSGPDPKGADQQEAQSFLRIYSHPTSMPFVAPPDQAAVARDKASIGAAFDRIAQAYDRNITPATVTSTAQNPQGFDYGDAAVGAGIVGGLVLLTAAGGLTVRRRSQLRNS
jgi:hypothetical protein